MKRREFITILGGAVASPLVCPLAVRAQKAAMPVIGILHSALPEPNSHFLEAFRQGLSESGFIEGKNVAIEYRWAENQYDRLPALAADLVGRRVAVIFADGGTVSVLAAKAAATTIPIVFRISADPVKAGLVASFNRPGGNVTGVTVMTHLAIAKRFELLRDLLPTARPIGVLLNSNSPITDIRWMDMQTAASSLGRQVQILTASNESGLDAAFATLVQQRIGALVVPMDSFFMSRRDQLAALAARYAVPAIYEQREFVLAGGLLSYGTSFTDAYRQAGFYVARILKGAKPSELPVLQPIKFELVINLKTAKALGLAIPPSMLVAANEVIE
jgi:putative ABC transport system substrate-binding protein